jgi:hypothetical protein
MIMNIDPHVHTKYSSDRRVSMVMHIYKGNELRPQQADGGEYGSRTGDGPSPL